MQKKRTSIALFGGSFDPFHLGHLAVLRAAQQVDFLSYIIVMPAYVSPHKDKTVASATDRFEMVKLAVSTLPPTPPIIVSDWEIQRDAPTYTIDSVAEIKERYMPDEIYLILGSDSYATLQSWHRAEDLIDQVKLMVIDRKTVPVSSTEIREKILKSESIETLIPDVVGGYIGKMALYKKEKAPQPPKGGGGFLFA